MMEHGIHEKPIGFAVSYWFSGMPTASDAPWAAISRAVTMDPAWEPDLNSYRF
jgi:hypothetical protein